MFHEDVCMTCDDQLLDLIDYSYRLLTEIIHKLKQEYDKSQNEFKFRLKILILGNNEIVKNKKI